ncbi:serine/threonine-protein kinase [Streptomyces sp. NPDC048489]|uniref:serine/threonine-protein kinase n=1 Tax=Streptomyces sp. NPDC048489 TaxID=3154504 RepID=UPI00342D5FDF
MNNIDGVDGPPGQQRKVAGRYRLLSPLGEGGMGTVWRAMDETLHREVAVKEVRAPANLPVADIEKMYTRLEREAWAAARISNRNVVTVYDVATDDGRPWIVMELIRGRSLNDVIRKDGPLAPPRASDIGAEVLSALRAAHAVGVLHRDVKPANVLIADDGRVVLTDFGIAAVEGDSSLTMTGEVVGSPEYLPPERALGQPPGPESDLWSLGVLLYAAVEGMSPFRYDSPLSTLRAIVDDELPPPRRAGALTPVIEGLLRKQPNERLAAEQVEKDLRLIAAGSTASVATSLSSHPTPTALDTPTVGRKTPAAIPEQPLRSEATPTVGSPTYSAPTASYEDPGRLNVALGSTEVQPAGQRRNRRTVLIAGVAASVLVVGSLIFQLASDGQNQGRRDTAASSSSSSAKSDSASNDSPDNGSARTGDAQQGNTDQQAGAAGQGSSDGGQQVSTTVTGRNTTYVGACSPPADQAPTFTATFAVHQVPAEITYRWVSKDGSVVDHEWRTLKFARGGDSTGQDVVRLSAWTKTGTFSTEIGVEVKGAGRVTNSNTIPFTITCQDSAANGTSAG